MVLYRLHPIAYSRNREKQYLGLTIPDEVAQFVSGCHFRIEIKRINGKIGIWCESGCPIKPSKEEVEKYDFSDIKIKI
jgi:hypothetical protein